MVTEQRTQLTRGDVVVHSYDQPGWRGVVWHIEVAGRHYAVSVVDLPPIIAGYKTCETAVFPANADGSVENYGDLVMLDDVKDHEAAIAELIDQLNDEVPAEPTAAERIDQALDLLGRFDTPRDAGRVQALIGDLRSLLGGA